MTEPSREAFEKWAVGILGDNPNWCESGDCELAWQSWRASRETEQAQAVEPIGYIRHADKTFWPHPECAVYASVSPSLAPVYAHPAPPLAGERADLIAGIKHELAEFAHNKTLETLLLDAADMLESDAQPKQVTCQIYGHVVGACVECSMETEAQQGQEPVTYTTGHCEHHKQKGGCQLHNLQCGWPDCDRKPISTPRQMQPCAGRNCGSINPNLHSAECFEDYEKSTGMHWRAT